MVSPFSNALLPFSSFLSAIFSIILMRQSQANKKKSHSYNVFTLFSSIFYLFLLFFAASIYLSMQQKRKFHKINCDLLRNKRINMLQLVLTTAQIKWVCISPTPLCFVPSQLAIYFDKHFNQIGLCLSQFIWIIFFDDTVNSYAKNKRWQYISK